jgi:vacuolar-type H+-ATPase subunit I/STV1
MKTTRFLAVGLLLLSGLLHVVQITKAATLDAAIVITVTFGIIYLVLGSLLIRGSRTIFWLGAILPLVGLLLATVGMLTNPTLLGAFFIVSDIAVATCCFVLIFKKSEMPFASSTGQAK